MKFVYSIDYQLNGCDGVVGWGDIAFTYPRKMDHADLKEARAEILKRAQRDWGSNPMNRIMRGGCPIMSVSILNVWGGAES